ncbi:hypothetical protein BOX30_05885 [Leptospirillum ferriphilum]|nr:hypothetical protein BOX30_05885 [Leptospirillum ferriphilum]
MKDVLPCFWGTLSFLSRYPVPVTLWTRDSGIRICAGWFPIAGLLVGLAPALADRVSDALPVLPGALLVVLVWTFVTGGLHWDGWADSIETALSGQDADEKKRIRKDPHLGTFGILALMAGFLTKLFLIAGYAFGPWDVVGVVLWGRGILPLFLFLVRRLAPEVPLSEGLGGMFVSEIRTWTLLFSSIVTGTALVFLVGVLGTIVFLAGLPLSLIPARWILIRQDSFSGDFIGFCIELLEMTALVFLGILRSHSFHPSLSL